MLKNVVLSLLMLVFASIGHAAPSMGKPVQEFTALQLSGSMFQSAEYSEKPILVVFWASWCPPCKSEMVELEKIYQRYKGSGLEIVAISLDKDRQTAVEFMKELPPVSFPVAMSNDRHNEIFGPLLWPPRMFLIGRDGRLIGSHWGVMNPKALDAFVRAAI
jgi:thiol-disulfide isomerase/thioredoxin